nr:putative ribonuclease H-like domain-containing protein [Tanacetum cinerariifolium]
LGLDKYIREGELGIDDSQFSIFHTKSDDLEGQPIYNSDRSSEPSTNDLQTCDSSVECSRPNHSDRDSSDYISSVSAPASESRDTIVIDCDKQEDFPSICSIETDVKSSKPFYFYLIKDCDLYEQRFAKRNAEGKGKLGRRPTWKQVNPNRPKPVSTGQPNLVSAGPPNPVFAGQPNPVSAGDGILGPRPLNIQTKSKYFHSFTYNNQQIIFPITHNSLYSLYMTGGLNGKTAVKPSAGWPWTQYGMSKTKGSKINGGSKSKSWSYAKGPLSRPKSEMTWGIRRDYSNARTPQQNGVAERKNQTLIEVARTMLADSLHPTIFWSEAVATASYVLNRVLVTKPHHKTPYELLTRDKPSISYLKPFGYHVTILNTSDPLGKFDKKLDEGYIVGYSISRTGQAWMFDIDYLTDSLNYSRVSRTNLSAGSQGATPSNAGSHEDDSDSDDEPDVLIIHSTPTLVARTSRKGGSCTTPPVSAGSTPLMSPCASPISAGRPVSTGRPSSSGARAPIPTGRILGKLPSNTPSERFPRAFSVENSDIHDGLKIFDYPKSGIFTSSSYDEEFSSPDANNLASSVDVSCKT